MTRNQRLIIVIGVAALVLGSCAAGDARFTVEEPAGFWLGLWHGFIAVIAFVVGLFSEDVEIYERFNRGAWYDLGFLIGVACFSGCGGRSHRRLRKSKSDKDTTPSGTLHVNADISWTPNDEINDDDDPKLPDATARVHEPDE